MYDIGDRIAYPMHGAGTVEAIEERTILGESRRYYVLHFQMGGIAVMVPVEGSSGLRNIITIEGMKQVLLWLGSGDETLFPNWNRRYRANMDKIRSGDSFEIADVVRTLILRDHQHGLSTGEKRMLVTARQILTSEFCACSGLPEDEVEQMITTAVG